MHAILTPTFLFEGVESPRNLDSLQALSRASHNSNVHSYSIRGADHFSILAPLTTLVAQRILGDTGGQATTIGFEESELNSLITN